MVFEEYHQKGFCDQLDSMLSTFFLVLMAVPFSYIDKLMVSYKQSWLF